MRNLRLFIPLVLMVHVAPATAAEPQKLSRLLKALQTPEQHFELSYQVELLGFDLGLDAWPAIPLLIRALDSPQHEMRVAAAEVLKDIGREAAPAIPKLVEQLDQGELCRISTEVYRPQISTSAALALGSMGTEAVGPLVRCLSHADSAVRSNGAFALGLIGPEAKVAGNALIERLKDPDELVRRHAAWALGTVQSDAKATIPALLESLLQDKDGGVRARAARALGSILPTTRAVVDGLVQALQDKEAGVQAMAAAALGALGNDAVPAVPALCRTLRSRKVFFYPHAVLSPLAGFAARALGDIGPSAREALPSLLAIIRDTRGTLDEFGHPANNYRVRAEAVLAASRIGPESPEVLQVLSRSLERDDLIRRQAAVGLARIGPRASSAVPLLLKQMIEDRSNEVLFASAAAAIDPNNVRAKQMVLTRLAANPPRSDDGWDVLRTALARIGAESPRAVPLLITLLHDDAKDHKRTIHTLAAFDHKAEAAVPSLIDGLAKWSIWYRPETIAALQRIASDQTDSLRAAAKHPNPRIRSGVMEVFASFPGALPILTEALSDPSARVRLAAVSSLAKLGEAGKPAIPHIRERLKDDCRTIRKAARKAIEELGGDETSDASRRRVGCAHRNTREWTKLN